MATPGPSPLGAFDILEAVDRDRLVLLKYNLRVLWPGYMGATVLLTLS